MGPANRLVRGSTMRTRSRPRMWDSFIETRSRPTPTSSGSHQGCGRTTGISRMTCRTSTSLPSSWTTTSATRTWTDTWTGSTGTTRSSPSSVTSILQMKLGGYNRIAGCLQNEHPHKAFLVVPKCRNAFDILDDDIVFGFPMGYSDVLGRKIAPILVWRGRKVHLLGASPPDQYAEIQRLTQRTSPATRRLTWWGWTGTIRRRSRTSARARYKMGSRLVEVSGVDHGT